MAKTFAHIVNAVPKGTNAQLEKEQKTAFRCMINAQSLYETPRNIDLLALTFANESLELATEIKHLPLLKRSSLDKVNDIKKKLPFLKDILTEAAQHTSAEYLIYTNVDICIVPAFYTTINKYLDQGYDAIVVNRRRVSSKYLEEPDLDLLFAETGRLHPGYDCFVFKRSLLDKFILTDVCIGVPPACCDLFHNLFCFAQNPVLFTEKQLTYHIGLDLKKNWGEKKLERYNYSELNKILKQLKPHIDISRFPGAELPFFKRHFKWLMNPTFSYPIMLSKDISQWRRKRKPRKKPEIPGLQQRYFEWLIRKIGFKD